MADACVTVPLGPACANITGVRAGDRNEMPFSITQNGVPVDLTGQVLSAQARKKITDATPAITAVVTIIDAVNGKGTIRWPGDQVTASMNGKPSWTGVWDLQMSPGPMSEATTLVEGKFTAVMDVTR